MLSSGNVVLGDTLYMTHLQRTFAIAVSREMVPNARLLVYGVLRDGEVLADCLSFHVKGVRGKGVGGL